MMKHTDDYDIDCRKLNEESNRLKEKWGRIRGFNSFYFNWGYGFDVYSKEGIKGKCIFNIDGISDAFSDFSTFNRNIMSLNVGYRRPSCNCGGQEDFNNNVAKFYDFLIDFYENDLKEEEWEDEEDKNDEW